jgi:acetyl esterase/lipase
VIDVPVPSAFPTASTGPSGTPRWNTWLNEHGYAVFDIEYRLEPAPTWRHAAGDVQCAVAWVRRHADRFGVDPDRLVLMGSSAGGHLALLAAYAADEDALPPSCDIGRSDVQAVVALYPPTDLVHSYDLADGATPLDGRAILKRFTGGTPDSAPFAYRMASPITHVAPDSPPTFLAQGAHDRMQSPIDSVMLADRLAEEDVEHELVWLEHAGHAFHASWGGFASQMTRPLLVDFLDCHVGPGAGEGAGRDSSHAGG